VRSIRLSLVVFFLALLAAALAAVAGLTFQSTRQALLAKEASTRELLRARHTERCRQERARLDDALLYQAHALANLAQRQFQGGRGQAQPALGVLGALAAGSVPQGHLLVPLWAAEVRGPLAFRLSRLSATELVFPEGFLCQHADTPEAAYFQVNSDWGGGWRSPSLGGRSFPFDPALFARTPLYDWKFDDAELPAGVAVRRVTLKAPVSRLRFVWGASPGRPVWQRPPPRAPGPAPRERFSDSELPAIWIQCAGETAGLEAALAGFREDLDGELATLEAETQETLAALRRRLLGISLATFAVAVACGLGLVRRGLAPLQRLSEAVSRVSDRDFRLRLDDAPLPRELRPIVERLRRTLGSLQRAFAREKQAAADLSHELRTPLAALLTTLDVALRKPRAPEEYRQALRDCQAGGRQMSQLVERLLTLARLDAGADRLRPAEVDTAALAGQCAALVRPLAEARGVRLSVHCQGPAVATLDEAKLREVLLNLLHNAIEYNRPDGSVELLAERHNGALCLEVRDTGLGIAPAALEHLFERFYRADPARGGDGLHAGLGLAIVQGYVELLGGTVTVDSTEGKGSTFRVRLPV
jgi:heavy metal sensor kinase